MSDPKAQDVDLNLQYMRKVLGAVLVAYADRPETLGAIFAACEHVRTLVPGHSDIQTFRALDALLQGRNAPDTTISAEQITLNNEAVGYIKNFERWGNIEDLERAIANWRRVVDLCPQGDPDKPMYLTNLGGALQTRFRRHGSDVDLEDAISSSRAAVNLTTDTHPDKAGFISNLGNGLQTRFSRHGSLEDLEDAVSSSRAAVSLTPDGHPAKPGRLNVLGVVLETRFDRHGSLVDLEDAISSKRGAVNLTPDGHLDKPIRLNNLGNALRKRFNQHGSLVDLEEAISIQRAAVNLTPDGHPDKPRHFNNLGSALETRFDRHGSVVDLEEAISSNRAAVNLTPNGHQNKPGFLHNLGCVLQRRFARHGSLEDLEDAISSLRAADSLTPDGHPGKPDYFSSLGTALQTRFDRHGSLVDLEGAISSKRSAISLTPDGHPNKPDRLSSLGSALQTRFNRHGSLVDLEEAISSQRAAVNLTPDGHPDKPSRLSYLGNALWWSFNRHSSLVDLEEAISSQRAAVNLTPDGHPNKAGFLSNLGAALETRFDRHGLLVDLEDAISSLRAAVRLTPDGHPDRSKRLSNLGSTLRIRFDRHGSLMDLEDAISSLRTAVSLTPDDHPGKQAFFTRLGSALRKRFDRHGSLVDLEDAISSLRAAASLIPDDHPDKPSHLSNLGNALQMRFNRNGLLLDLEEAISSLRAAVYLTPDGHREKPGCLNNLGTAILMRFNRNGLLVDLEEAISSLQAAVNLTPDGHPNLPSCLYNLASTLEMKYSHSGEKHHIQTALLATKELAETSSASSKIRLEGALRWANYSAMLSISSIPAFKCAINLLPQVAWLGLAVDDQYALLVEAGKAVRDAVAATIAEGDWITAIEWAEQGRSIVWQNLLSLRAPLDTLRIEHPALAKRLQEISRQMERPEEAPMPLHGAQSTEKADYQIRLAMERDELIDEVRTKPRFGNFLKPKSLEELAPAARGGPVVFLNLGRARCDALVLLTDDHGVAEAVSVPLERVTLQKTDELYTQFVSLLKLNGVRAGGPKGRKTKDVNAAFKDVLRTLWLDYVQPVIDGLAYSVNLETPPRLWWCTTGSLSFLPVHAAGIYDMKEAGHKLSDYVASSYTPTLTALLDSSSPSMSDGPNFLTIAMSETPGQSPLPSTKEEAEKVQRFAANLPIVALQNEEATKERVLKEMGQSSWVHLACHGEQVGGKPMESGLIFHDGKLEMSEIIKTRLPKADFAFLSACQTAVGDGGVPEESAHLAAGMLFAGYRGVIATMWSIEDHVAPRVAEDVYRYLFRHGQPRREEAAYALHRAVRSLQESGVSFISWMPFIHLGR